MCTTISVSRRYPPLFFFYLKRTFLKLNSLLSPDATYSVGIELIPINGNQQQRKKGYTNKKYDDGLCPETL
jgi:hypothetical protein